MPISDQSPDPVARALSQVEPGTRALLALSLRRALSDQALAKRVAADPGEITLRRERALDAIAAEAGIEGPGAREQVSARLLAVPSEVWLATAGPDPPQAPGPGPPPGHVPPAPIAAVRTQRGAAQRPALNRDRVMALLALFLVAALMAVALLQVAGSSDETAPGPAPAPDAPAQQAPTSHFQTPLIQVQRA